MPQPTVRPVTGFPHAHCMPSTRMLPTAQGTTISQVSRSRGRGRVWQPGRRRQRRRLPDAGDCEPGRRRRFGAGAGCGESRTHCLTHSSVTPGLLTTPCCPSRSVQQKMHVVWCTACAAADGRNNTPGCKAGGHDNQPLQACTAGGTGGTDCAAWLMIAGIRLPVRTRRRRRLPQHPAPHPVAGLPVGRRHQLGAGGGLLLVRSPTTFIATCKCISPVGTEH